jgi:hypothetical protein
MGALNSLLEVSASVCACAIMCSLCACTHSLTCAQINSRTVIEYLNDACVLARASPDLPQRQAVTGTSHTCMCVEFGVRSVVH